MSRLWSRAKSPRAADTAVASNRERERQARWLPTRRPSLALLPARCEVLRDRRADRKDAHAAPPPPPAPVEPRVAASGRRRTRRAWSFAPICRCPRAGHCRLSRSVAADARRVSRSSRSTAHRKPPTSLAISPAVFRVPPCDRRAGPSSRSRSTSKPCFDCLPMTLDACPSASR